MTIKYVTTGAWGAGIARPLTAAEADGNIYTLEQAIQNLIDNPVAGVSVSNIAVVGRQVTFYMTDATTYGPFDLPVAVPIYRGAWTATYAYAAYDIVQVAGYGTYMVLQDHTAVAPFDPNAGDTSGDFYIQIGPDAYYTSQVQTVSAATLTLALGHQNKYLRATNAGGLVVTLNAGIFPDNAEIHFRQTSGAITVVAGAGVTINAPAGYDAGSASVGAVFSLKCVSSATNVWDIFGKLAEVSV